MFQEIQVGDIYELNIRTKMAGGGGWGEGTNKG